MSEQGDNSASWTNTWLFLIYCALMTLGSQIIVILKEIAEK